MPSKTLVIQPLPGIGDMVWHLPCLRALARYAPDKKISVLTKSSVQLEKLLGHEEFIEDCLALPPTPNTLFKDFKLLQSLRSKAYQNVWILHHSPRYGLLTRLAGIPNRNGYGFGLQKKFLTAPRYIAEGYKREGPQERAKALLTINNIPYSEDDQILTPCPQALREIKDKFKTVPKEWAVLGIGASQQDKCWSPANFAKLASLLKEHRNLSIFLVCSPQEKERGEAIVKKAQQEGVAPLLVSDLSLDQVTALISQALFYVGNCSGPLNIAACLTISSFGLFGVTPPLTYAPSLIPIVPPSEKKSLGMNGLTVEYVFEVIASTMATKIRN